MGLLVLVLAAGLLLRLVVQSQVPREIRGDSRQYLLLASNLAQGRGFSHSPGPLYPPDCLRTPGYVAFLVPFVSLAVEAPRAVYLAQSLLDLACAAALYYLVVVTVGGRLRPLLAASLYAAHPLAAALATQVLADGGTALLVVIWLLFLGAAGQTPRAGLWAASGGAALLLALWKPALLPLALGVHLGLALGRRGPAWLGLALLLVLLAPWAWRNYQVGGQFTPMPLASLGGTMYLGLVRTADPPLTHQGEEEWRVFERQWGAGDVWPPEAMRVDRRLKEVLVQAIAAHPDRYFQRVLQQAGELWWSPGGVAQNVAPEVLPRAFTLARAAVWFQRGLVLLALVGLARSLRRLPDLRLHLLVVGYVGLIYPLVLVEGRFLAPALPSLCLFASLAFEPLRPREMAPGLPPRGDP
ncbi:MAG TPA: hypothetical protein VNO81_05525 [Candidatus Nitrosotenuis sp.]|nr:hypothetical protein [Candidatus Nitrosotenuis sp.]